MGARNILRYFLVVIVVGGALAIAFGVAGEFFIELAREKGLYNNPSRRWDAIMTAFREIVTHDLVLWPAFLLLGLTAGVWLDAILRRVDGRGRLVLLPLTILVVSAVGFVGSAIWLLHGIKEDRNVAVNVESPRPAGKATTAQPKLTLIAPSERYELRWDPLHSYGLTHQEESRELQPGHWRYPEFVLKNESEVAAQDVRVRWEADTAGLKEIAESSKRLANHKVEFKGTSLILGGNFTYPLAASDAYQVPFVTDEVKLYPPISVWTNALIYILATLPDANGEEIQPFFFTVSVCWKIPPNGATQRFRVKVMAANVKPSELENPELLAMMRFHVEELISQKSAHRACR